MDRVKELKEQLLEIGRNDWTIPEGIDTYAFALEMMENIGTTDPELRDDLILTVLWKMITEKSLSKDEVRGLMDICLSDKHLFYKLGLEEDDSVFNRAFTILIVRLIIYYNNELGEDTFTQEEMLKISEEIIRYVRLEKDVRGYVEIKGWAHAVAHSGDTLRTLVLCNYIQKEQLLEILEVIKEKFNISDYVYINEEAERMVSAVINIINREIITEEEVIDWIRSFGKVERSDEFPKEHYLRENLKNFLRSLYFRLKFKKAPVVFLEEIEVVLNNISKTFNNILE